MIVIRFECGVEDRFSDWLGPFEYIQATYTTITASPDGTVTLANLNERGFWETPDGQVWTDFVICAQEVLL